MTFQDVFLIQNIVSVVKPTSLERPVTLFLVWFLFCNRNFPKPQTGKSNHTKETQEAANKQLEHDLRQEQAGLNERRQCQLSSTWRIDDY